MNKIISRLLKSNIFLLGMLAAFIVLTISDIIIQIEFEYMIAKVSFYFVLSDTSQIISKMIQDNEIDNYRYKILSDLEEDDISEFICLANYENRKVSDLIMFIMDYISIMLKLIGFAMIIILPLQVYESSIDIEIQRFTLLVFAFVFFNIFLNEVSENLSGYYHETFKSKYLYKKQCLSNNKAVDGVLEIEDILISMREDLKYFERNK